MDSIIIRGGTPLIGEIEISGSKNASLPLMVASLLTEDSLVLSNVPKLSDINTMKLLLSNHGTCIDLLEQETCFTLNLSSKNINNFVAPYDIVRKMRASIWVLGALLTRFSEAKVSLPGGCAIGARLVDMHLSVMKKLGAKISIEDGYIIAKVNGRLRGCDFNFTKNSVGATINAILAAVLAEGESNFLNCAIEPEISDLCNCLVAMGAEIYGIGTSNIKIIGKEKLSGANYQIMPDRIEAGTYMVAAAATRGNVLLKNIDTKILDSFITCMRKAGIDMTNENNGIRITHNGKINAVDISTAPYPGFPTDLQAQFMTLMTLADGVSEVQENIFENRFMHVPELCRMGANISIKGNKAIIKGTPELRGAEVMASDLRASVSLIIAGLAAQGDTKVRRIYHLDRGYQSLEQKLANCGANVLRVKGDQA
jgi:UDP-N-acetylglucosamine 1-carboxyvinyltransferase